MLAELAGVLEVAKHGVTDGNCPSVFIVSISSVEKFLNTPRAAATLRIVDAVLANVMQQLRSTFSHNVLTMIIGTGHVPSFSSEAINAAFTATKPILRRVCD